MTQAPTNPFKLASKIVPTDPKDSFAIAFAPLSLSDVYQLAGDDANGAIVLMSGVVRNQTEGNPVLYLEYQAYEPMALQVFKQIAHQARSQWSEINRVIIHHRIGKLHIGEISVLVAVACPHRGEAFAACRYAIDTLKHNAPIWKKEYITTPKGTIASNWVSIGACEENCE